MEAVQARNNYTHMFNLPDLTKLEKSINDNTAVQLKLYEQMVLMNKLLQELVNQGKTSFPGPR